MMLFDLRYFDNPCVSLDGASRNAVVRTRPHCPSHTCRHHPSRVTFLHLPWRGTVKCWACPLWMEFPWLHLAISAAAVEEQAGLDHSLLLHQIMWTLSQQNSVLETDVLEDCSDGFFFFFLFKQQSQLWLNFLFLFLKVSHYFKNPFLFVWQK